MEEIVSRGKVIDIDASKMNHFLNNFSIAKSIPKEERKKIFRGTTKPIRKAVQDAFKSSVTSDPRKAVQGVKTLIYKNGLGANVNIISVKKASKTVRASIVRTGGVSGIIRHRKRSADTERVDSYWGKDRAFILRFLSDGTQARPAFTKNRSKNGKTANRGALVARDFFRRSVDGAKVTAEKYLSDQINEKLARYAKSEGAEVKG